MMLSSQNVRGLLHSLILRSYLCCVSECSVCMHISVPHAVRLWCSEEGVQYPEMGCSWLSAILWPPGIEPRFFV